MEHEGDAGNCHCFAAFFFCLFCCFCCRLGCGDDVDAGSKRAGTHFVCGTDNGGSISFLFCKDVMAGGVITTGCGVNDTGQGEICDEAMAVSSTPFPISTPAHSSIVSHDGDGLGGCSFLRRAFFFAREDAAAVSFGRQPSRTAVGCLYDDEGVVVSGDATSRNCCRSRCCIKYEFSSAADVFSPLVKAKLISRNSSAESPTPAAASIVLASKSQSLSACRSDILTGSID